MAATNEKALSSKPGILEVALFDNTIPELADDNSNIVAYKTALDNLTYVRGASIIDLTVTDDFAAKITKIETDDNGTIYRESEPACSVTGNIYELDNDFLNKIYPNALTAIAGVLVPGATQNTITGAYAFNEFIKIANQNGDKSAVVVNSVTGATDGLLAAGTDYLVSKNSAGEYGIVIIDSATVTTMDQVFTIDYDYTPNEATVGAIKIKGQELPRLVVRVKAVYNATQSKIDYVVDSGFEGQILKKFSDVSRSGELGNSPFTFNANRLGVHVFFDDYNV